jgi:hypothetical protein
MGWKIYSSISSGGKNFLFPENVQIGSGNHHAFNTMGKGHSFPRGKAAWVSQ